MQWGYAAGLVLIACSSAVLMGPAVWCDSRFARGFAANLNLYINGDMVMFQLVVPDGFVGFRGSAA